MQRIFFGCEASRQLRLAFSEMASSRVKISTCPEQLLRRSDFNAGY